MREGEREEGGEERKKKHGRGKCVAGGGSSRALFSRCFLLPPFLPPRGADLDVEECAPCSVSGENRGAPPAPLALTYFSVPPQRFVFLRRPQRKTLTPRTDAAFYGLSVCGGVTGPAPCFGML